MNKLALLSCLAVSAIAFNVNAKTNMGGGFNGPSVSVVTVEQAKGLKDDTYVTLRGNIQQQVGEELYIFSDGSGSINIEIDDEDWNGQNIAPEDMVEIKGEIDKGWTSIEIDVDQVNKVSK